MPSFDQVQKRRRPRAPARPWPLLKPGQDPTALEAVTAFHLHRLKLTGKRLRDCGFCRGKLVPLLVQGGMCLTSELVCELAAALGVPSEELTRPLTDEETREWRYYRFAAAHPDRVWSTLQRIITAHGLTLAETAAIMGMERGHLVRNLSNAAPRGHRVLSYAAASRFCLAMGMAGGTDGLIDSRDIANHENRLPCASQS